MSDLVKIDLVGGIPIYSVTGQPPSFLFKAGMSICADGSPRCYGPNNSGLDYTANGGTPGKDWWGGPTDSHGMPLIQAIYDPYPGMYVSGTAHFNPAYSENSPYCYLDAEAIPFIVLPGGHACGAALGDVCLCLNTVTGDNCYGIYGDIGPSDQIGEASMRMATGLKVPNDPKKGGLEVKGIAYLVFPGSVSKWMAPNLWFGIADKVFNQWGSLARLKKLLNQFP